MDVAEDTLDHAEGCTTSSAEDEEMLGLSLPVRVKEDITSRVREMKKNDEKDSEDEENKDDNG